MRGRAEMCSGGFAASDRVSQGKNDLYRFLCEAASIHLIKSQGAKNGVYLAIR
jgi:hypothetical protein